MARPKKNPANAGVPASPPPPTAPADTAKEREIEVARLLALCLPSDQIVYRVAKRFKCSEASVYRQIDATMARYKAPDTRTVEERRNQMRETLGIILAESVSFGKMTAAVQAADRLCQLDGLYTTIEAEKDKSPDVLTQEPDRIRNRVRELMQKHAKHFGYVEAESSGEPN